MKTKVKIMSSLMLISLFGGVIANSYLISAMEPIRTVIPNSLDEIADCYGDDDIDAGAETDGESENLDSEIEINCVDDFERTFEQARANARADYVRRGFAAARFDLNEYYKMRRLDTVDNYRECYLNSVFGRPNFYGSEWLLKEDKGDHGTPAYFEEIIRKISTIATEEIDVSRLVSCLRARNWVEVRANLESIVSEMRVKFGTQTRAIDNVEPFLYKNLFCYRVSKLGGLVLDYAINAYEHNDEEGAMAVIQYIIDNGYCDNDVQMSIAKNTVAGKGCGYKPDLRGYLYSMGFGRTIKGVVRTYRNRIMTCPLVQTLGFFVSPNCEGLTFE